MGARFYSLDHSQNFYQQGVSQRALTTLRAHAQTVPNFTLYIDAGSVNIKGRHIEWDGGNSSAFTPPTTSGMVRIDLLYMDFDGFHVVTGTEVLNTFTPVVSPAPDGTLWIVEVLLYYGQTSITESDIFFDPREFLSVANGKIETWSYADAATRTGATGFVANDIGRVGYQEDTGVYWRLTAITPTWEQITGVDSVATRIVCANDQVICNMNEVVWN